MVDAVEEAVSHRFPEGVAPQASNDRANCFRLRHGVNVQSVVAFSSSGLRFLGGRGWVWW